MLRRRLLLALLGLSALNAWSGSASDRELIERAVLGYIEAQHQSAPELMAGALHHKLVKRTFWHRRNGEEYIRETDYDTMIYLAGHYNKSGDRFPKNPLKEVTILDVDRQVATVKLSADDWIDYMHLIKVNNHWKIVNVVWQYKDIAKHR